MAIVSLGRGRVSHSLAKKKKGSQAVEKFRLFPTQSQYIVCYDSTNKEFRKCRWGESFFIHNPYHFQKLGIHLRKRFGPDVESMAYSLLKSRYNIDLVKKYHQHQPLRQGDVKKVYTIAKELNQVVGKVNQLFGKVKNKERTSLPFHLTKQEGLHKACRLVELDAATLEALIKEANKRNP